MDTSENAPVEGSASPERGLKGSTKDQYTRFSENCQVICLDSSHLLPGGLRFKFFCPPVGRSVDRLWCKRGHHRMMLLLTTPPQEGGWPQ